MFTNTDTVILLDTPYLYHSVKNMEPGAKLDYSKLIEFLDFKDIPYFRMIAFILDTGEDDDRAGFDNFTARLRDLGIEVVIHKPRGKGGAIKTDCNVAIAVEAMGLINKTQAIILASGDSDLVPLISRLNASGIKTGIMAFKKSASKELREMAHEFIELGPELFIKK